MSALGQHSTLPSEARLVLLTGCGDWVDARIVETIAERLDWTRVAAFATREHACAATASRLIRLGVPSEAKGALAALERQGAVEEFRMVLLEERLERLMARLGDAGIDFVLLKGAAVSLRFFGTLKERPMGDLDLLVRTEHAASAHAAAQELGWVPREGLREDLYVGMPHLPPLVAGDGLGFGLEIHTRLFPEYAPFGFSADDVWRRAARLPRPGGPAVPAPEHLLLHACLHFAWSHGFRRGAWRMVRDVDALLADAELRKEEFARLAVAARGETCVYWTFALFEQITGRAVLGVLTEGRRIANGPLNRALLRHVLLLTAFATEAPGTRRLSRLLWGLAIRPRASGHGDARPWKSDERWLDPPEEGTAETERLGDRFSGFLAYARRVLGFEPQGRSAGL